VVVHVNRNPAASFSHETSGYFHDPRGYLASWEGDMPDAAFYHERRRLVVAFLEGVDGRLLDAGCGPGVMADVLLSRGFEYDGIDRSEAMIATARERYLDDPRPRFQVADIQDLPFDADSFDVVLALGVLEYISNLEQAMDEIVRVLRPHGVFVFSMLNRSSPYRTAERILGTNGQPLCKNFAMRDADQLLVRHGLARGESHYYDFNMLIPPFDSRLPRVARSFQRRLAFLDRTPLRWLGTAFVVQVIAGVGLGM
jgi:SAM-dependent methyltransferase